MKLTIERYEEERYEEWEHFITESMNGTFLQSRCFLSYHGKDKFRDHSLMFYKGNTLIAVVPACSVDNQGKFFSSHMGSSYGGIIINEKYYDVTHMDEIMNCLEEYLKEKGFTSVFLKMTPDLYTRSATPLVDYFLSKNNYKAFTELNFYLDLEKYKDGIIENFSSSKRRDYRYSLRNDLLFRKLQSKDEIEEFYTVLQSNQKKLGISAVHSLEELIDLKDNRLQEKMDFYGVYFEGQMIAGSMIFRFENNVFHTQYLASEATFLKLFPMDYLIFNLIQEAVTEGMKTFSFGICTEERGQYLNMGLSKFKEGFGSIYGVNRTYEKVLKK